jgi:cyclohexyl-isocyanide hydratase
LPFQQKHRFQENTVSVPPSFTIVFVLFDGVTQLDFAGPVQFFARLPGAQIHVVSKDGRAVSTDCGFSILPHGNFAECPQADLLCVPGGFGVAAALSDTALIDFVGTQAAGAKWVTSVCTGAFFLGAAGLLHGKRATTHWGYTHLLSKYGAEYEEARIVYDGNLITAGGVTSGLDFALSVIATLAGEDTAQSIQLACEYDPAPPFSGGHPSRTPKPIVDEIRTRFYDGAAQRMSAAIDTANDSGKD